jgi:predicted AlkP superfamily pyrophosphatase or phosphodiesterase
MTLAVLGIDALDPDLVDPDDHPNLVLADHRAIDTVESHTGEPSTHELWPTIITGLEPDDHGLVLEDDGVAWGNPVLAAGSRAADYLLPDSLQSRVGAWLLTNTDTDAFRTPATYYADNDIPTVFDEREAAAIGVPNYVVDPDSEDREHQLRRSLGDLFERDPGATGGHRSSDPETFYEQCMEMAMIRVARTRRAVRGDRYELIFAYTSGLDLIGHVTYDRPTLQLGAYAELDEFVGELRRDLDTEDDLLLVSDHGLQDGVHTDEAMVAATDPSLVADVESVTDVRAAIETELDGGDHGPIPRHEEQGIAGEGTGSSQGERVTDQLEDLGYL